ncbi:hypothetical protein PJE062_270 [Pseudovibrio sp. JE062]|nr:hypothetical protein PJE062_270 [Pseudovibrio sp. JE062]
MSFPANSGPKISGAFEGHRAGAKSAETFVGLGLTECACAMPALP